MIGQYVSLKQIIDELYGDNGHDINSIVYEDLIRWTVEALNKIKHPIQYRRRVTGSTEHPNLKIEDYRAKLPCNIHEIEQIAVNGQSATYATNTMHHLLGGECCGLENTTPIGNLPVSNGFYIDAFGNEFDAGSFNGLQNSGITYDLNNEYITLSVKTGEVCIAYLEFPFDSEGLPLIPDKEEYRQAVLWYLTMKLDYKLWRANPSSTGSRALFQYSEQQWLFYVGSASNAAKLRNVDQLEALKNQMVRTFQRFNHHGTFYRNLGQSQKRNIH